MWGPGLEAAGFVQQVPCDTGRAPRGQSAASGVVEVSVLLRIIEEHTVGGPSQS